MTNLLDALRTATPVSRTDDDDFRAVVARLSAQSVAKHHDAYEDIDWDGPDMALVADDPRNRLWALDPLARTDWYRSLPEAAQARVALHRVASTMRIGLEFENYLQRGLLDVALRLPQGSPEFRYVLHEVAEETHHTMMFGEFAGRAVAALRAGEPGPTEPGLRPIRAGGMPRSLQFLCAQAVLPLAWAFPELFFVFVLGGEEPIDHIQRQGLREGVEHPLAERVMRIHVTEEARHIGFAKSFLTKRIPQLGRVRRRILADVTPLVLGVMAPLMILPSARTASDMGIPRSARAQMRRDPETHRLRRDSVRKIRNLYADLGLLDRRATFLWKRVGLWDEPTVR